MDRIRVNEKHVCAVHQSAGQMRTNLRPAQRREDGASRTSATMVGDEEKETREKTNARGFI